MQLPFCFFGRHCTALYSREGASSSPLRHATKRILRAREDLVKGTMEVKMKSWRIFFLYIICKKTVNKRRGIKILRSFVNP